MTIEQLRDHRISHTNVQHRDGRQGIKMLTLFRMTSYAEMRSVATKSNVWSSISKISRTLPDAIFLMLYWLRSTLVTAASEDMMCDLSDECLLCFLRDVVLCSCVRWWWIVRLKLAGDWSLDLSSCEVGEFASRAGSLQSAAVNIKCCTCLYPSRLRRI